MSAMRVRENLDPYATVSLSDDRFGKDGDEADSNSSSPPYPHRERTIQKYDLEDADNRRATGFSGGTDQAKGKTKAPNLGDVHTTPGTLLREHRHDGYRKGTVTRPSGQGQGTDSGARMATMGTRDSTAQKRDDTGPFAEDEQASGDKGWR